MNNLLTKIKNRFKGLHKSRFINPHRHWAFLIQLFLSVILILIIFSFYLLYKIRNEQIFQVNEEPTTPVSLIKEKLLEETLESFDQKKERTRDIKAGLVELKDPS